MKHIINHYASNLVVHLLYFKNVIYMNFLKQIFIWKILWYHKKSNDFDSVAFLVVSPAFPLWISTLWLPKTELGQNAH